MLPHHSGIRMRCLSSWREKKIMKAQRQHISVNKCGSPFLSEIGKTNINALYIKLRPLLPVTCRGGGGTFGWYHCFGVFCSCGSAAADSCGVYVENYLLVALRILNIKFTQLIRLLVFNRSQQTQILVMVVQKLKLPV